MKIRIPQPSILSFLLIPFFILIIAGFTVPSDGGHGLLSIKSLAFISSVLSLLLYLSIRKKINWNQFKLLAFFIISLGCMNVWGITGYAIGKTENSIIFDQFKLVLLTVTIVIMTIYLVSDRVITFQTLLKTILLANFSFSTAKITLVLLHIVGFLDLWNIVKLLGLRIMGMQIIGNVFRFQASIDIATPFLLFFFLQSTHFGIQWKKTFKWMYLSISLFAIFLSFSRYLLFVAVLALLFHFITLRLYVMIQKLTVFLICMTIGVLLVGVDNVYTIVEKRVLSIANSNSDNIRRYQIDAMIEEHQIYPLMGKGLGAYAENYVRDTNIKHSYEVQWVAFLMQFGMIGIFLMLIALGFIAKEILSPPFTRTKVGLFVIFLCWLFSGFTNPFLISLTSGILYSLFYLAGKELKTSINHLTTPNRSCYLP